MAISAARLEQLLEAEITTLALRDPQPLTLQSILELTPTTDADQLAQLLHEELPVRFAQRIKMLEDLPDWETKVSIASVRAMYVTSFKELRLADPSEPWNFTRQIKKVKERHAQTNLLVDGFKQYAEVDELKEAQINEWLDRFFALRVSTNMLMSHYLQIARGNRGASTDADRLDFDPEYDPYRSSIDPQCSAPRIARYAADLVGKMSEMRYGVAPPILVADSGATPFPFVPRYLFYILSELLKNSVRATVETHRLCASFEVMEELPPIHVVVSGDENVCSCRISDEGGGIPVDRLNHVWSYLYTTAERIDCPVSRLAVDAPVDLRRLLRPGRRGGEGAEETAEMQTMLFRSPLAGLGCGLPLSRLYASYLGGSVELQTLPRYGTDVFVYLNRVGNSESLPHL